MRPLTEIASPWAADRTLARSVKGVHELMANALVLPAALHAAAALLHHWVFLDRTLALPVATYSMMPNSVTGRIQ